MFGQDLTDSHETEKVSPSRKPPIPHSVDASQEPNVVVRGFLVSIIRGAASLRSLRIPARSVRNSFVRCTCACMFALRIKSNPERKQVRIGLIMDAQKLSVPNSCMSSRTITAPFLFSISKQQLTTYSLRSVSMNFEHFPVPSIFESSPPPKKMPCWAGAWFFDPSLPKPRRRTVAVTSSNPAWVRCFAEASAFLTHRRQCHYGFFYHVKKQALYTAYYIILLTGGSFRGLPLNQLP